MRVIISGVFPLAGGAFLANSALMLRGDISRIRVLCSVMVLAAGFNGSCNAAESFDLSEVVHARVAAMKAPQMRTDMVGVQMSISSPSEKAREHVKQGFALVHAQWDFEAYRHFCAALAEDPDCLMAYCGVTLALVQPFGEYADQRRAAVTRMLDLIDADDEGVKNGKAECYQVMEKKFSSAIAALISMDPKIAAINFNKIADEYPQLIQARLIGLFLTRGGYDVVDEPSEMRKQALEKTRELMKKYPDNPMIMGFWLVMNAEVPLSAMDIKREILPDARTLVKKCPDVPTWQHALGHFEWRAGNYQLAERAFKRAIELYGKWMESDGVAMGDCAGYVKAKCYLANTYYQRGYFTGAMSVAQQLRAMKPDPQRPRCAGNHFILWRAYTLPARLYVARGDQGDLDRALDSLPSKEELDFYISHPHFPTLAGVYVETLSAYIGSRKAMEDQSLADAVTLRNITMRSRIQKMAGVVKGAMQASDYTHYFNAGSSLAVYDMELAGLIALDGKDGSRAIALNWFMSARDKQGIPSLMMPPLVLSPMENRLGEYYLRVGQNADAYEAYQEALRRYPNNMASLLGLKRALEVLEKKNEAALVQRHIDLIKVRK